MSMRRGYLYLFPLILLLAASWYLSCNRESSDPISNAGEDGSFLNLTSEAVYTGRQSCQPCHQEIYDNYIETGMGRSLYQPKRDEQIEEIGPEVVVYDTYSGYSYHPYWSGENFYIYEFRLENGDTTYRRRERIDYIVGSGHQTRSYLLEREGRFFEAPITWYVTRARWDLSPGYEDGQNTRFDRTIGAECMACHTGHFDYVEGTVNMFEEVSLGIDCEKCHGPGSIHIERKEAGELIDVGKYTDYSIVNPAKLSIKQRFDVCQQCHLQGVNVLKDGKSVMDFRPGMDLSEVYDIFIEEHNDDRAFGIASHAERLQQSRCFIASAGELVCTTCHDPHQSIQGSEVSLFTQQCESCHSDPQLVDCGIGPEMMAANDGNCITCHMPKGGTSDIPHVTFSDHFIRVVDTTKREDVNRSREFLRLVCMTDSSPAADLVGRAYLLYFERNAQVDSILQIADENIGANSHYAQARLDLFAGRSQSALQAIDRALGGAPDNTWYLFKKGEILESLNRPQEAMDVYRRVYALNTHLVEAGEKVGVLTLKLATEPTSALQSARQIFSECLQKKPFDKSILTNLGFVEMNSGNFPLAQTHFEKALGYDPGYLLALENLILLQLQQQDKPAARRYFDQLLKFHPDYPKKGMMEELLT